MILDNLLRCASKSEILNRKWNMLLDIRHHQWSFSLSCTAVWLKIYIEMCSLCWAFIFIFGGEKRCFQHVDDFPLYGRLKRINLFHQSVKNSFDINSNF